MFKLELYEGFELERVESDKGRYYKTPEGALYPSVTTILQEVYPKDLSGWIERVGEAEATKITNKAASRGTRIHKMCEDYVLNRFNPSKHMPFHLGLFKQIQPYLDKHVTTIYGSELRLYSDQLQAAGTTDLLCQAHGINTILDFKGSTKVKKEEYIEHYFLQATMYAMMAEERYNIVVPQIIIAIAVEDDLPQFFLKHTSSYREKALQTARKHARLRAVDLFSNSIV